MNPNDGNVNGIFSAVRALLIAIGGVMATKGLENTGAYFWVETISGSIMIVGPAAWGVYTAFANYFKARKAVAAGVQAGINLTASGKAISDSGDIITRNDGTTPPKLVTLETAPKIVAEYAPAVSEILKA